MKSNLKKIKVWKTSRRDNLENFNRFKSDKTVKQIADEIFITKKL